MQALLWPIVTWIFREIVIKFSVFVAVFALLGLFVPFCINLLGTWISPSWLTSAFGGVPAGVWYFLDLFRIDYGLPLCLSAIGTRFLIRRLPVIG